MMNKINLEEWELVEDKERFKEVIDELLSENYKSIKKVMDKLEKAEHKKNRGVVKVLNGRAKNYM